MLCIGGADKNTDRFKCGVTQLGEDWLATSWPQRGSKYSDFVLQMTDEADLLEAAITVVVT
jgi:hypothetical protein